MSEFVQLINKTGKKISQSLLKDRFHFYREYRKLKKLQSSELEESKNQTRISDLTDKVEQSIEKRNWRMENIPKPLYNESLPVTRRKDEIVEAIKNNQVIIISGETGSGKTTQLPKFCIEAGRGVDGTIACTQPRRIAAITVSARIAEELGEEVGKSVGYKIRFQDKAKDNAFIKIMTDGILLAEAQSDGFLNEYDTIIVDEAHERSLNIDFILGILRTLINRRKDIKIIITSATIDTKKFSKAFKNAPIIEVTGRTFPVEVIYKPVTEANVDKTFVERAVKAVEDIQGLGPYGDILIFMPTEADIKETCELLEGRQYLNATVLPLFARLSAGEQKAIFKPATGRKIVIATNVAETSITIPGIKYVIDTGLARIPQYTPRTRTTSLPVTTISKSSADQRKGRCGRVENGVCIRLFSEEDYNSRLLFTPPEILRANLAEVILRMISLNLGEVESFPFIDPPAAKSIQDGFSTLLELGAIKQVSNKKKAPKTKQKLSYQLTGKGRIMAKIPVNPKLSRMFIEAEKLGCLEDITIIIAALSIRDPRERPADKAQQADQAQAVFKDPYSDFISILNIWKLYSETTDNGKSLGKLKKFCKKHYLSFMRMREWKDIHYQLSSMTKENGLTNNKVVSNSKPNKSQVFGDQYQAIHKAVLSGYISNIATKKEKNIYHATRGREVMVFPGSALFNKAGQWIVASEMVETSKLFARNVANIDNGWLEELGQESCRYSYSNPHWEKKKGAVIAYEQVSLFGLIIVSERKVQFGRIDPSEASIIFIRSALVNGDIDFSFAKKEMDFLGYNLKLVNEVRDIEDRVRRRDILVDEEDLFNFYHRKLDGIYDIRSLVKLIKEKGGSDFLKMTPEKLYNYTPESEELSLYPETIEISGGNYSCDYDFQPGKSKDGVTIKIPCEAAPSLPQDALDWLVPGFLKEKIEMLIKGLPKEYRKKLVPVTNTVDIILKNLPELNSDKSNKSLPENSLISSLGKFIYDRFNINIPASAWPKETLPDHLKMRIAVTASSGKILASSREKNILKQDYSVNVDQDQLKKLKIKWEKTGISKWNFGNLPESIELNENSDKNGVVFPALVVEENTIALRLFKTNSQAAKHHLDGVRRLYEKHFSNHLKSLKKDMTLTGNLKNYSNYFGGEKVFSKNLYERLTQDLFSKNIRSDIDFQLYAEETAPLIYQTGQKLLGTVKGILEAFHQARTIIFNNETGKKKGSLAIADEIRKCLTDLAPDSFLKLYNYDRLIHIERYIKAISLRAERAFTNPEKDKIKTNGIKYFEVILSEYLNSLTPDVSIEKRNAVEDFFWMIEEYKVSVFAQELKTPIKISKKRLEKAGNEIRRMV